VSHAHYCANDGGWPTTSPLTYRHTLAFTAQPTGTLLKDTEGYPNHQGMPAPSIINWFPDMTVGSYTGQSQSAWTVTGNSKYVLEGGEFPTVNNVGQQGLVRFAVHGIAPAKQAPRLTGTHMTPSLSVVNGDDVRIQFPSDWDRDDHTLYYSIVRDGNAAHPVTTFSSDSTFWYLPTLVYIEPNVPAGTHQYRIWIRDADGNTVKGDSANITVP
jgi:hypothetical protein